jgi:RNA polymerase sigma-70 factor (ECF subfamily)
MIQKAAGVLHESTLGDPLAASDRSLLRRYQEGDQAAATDLYRRYAHRLRGLARKHFPAELSSRLDADDIVQSVFRTFFHEARQGVYQVPAGKDLWNLLLVIALNKIRANGTYHRAAKRDVRVTVVVDNFDCRVNSATGTHRLNNAFFEAVVRESLEQLPATHRQAVQLRMEGFEVDDIATKTGRAKRTIERNLQDARAKLSVLLERNV